MSVDMQARRDAFLMLTGEEPPAEPNRWLVMWGRTGVDYGWNDWADEGLADEDAAAAIEEGYGYVKVYDLDAE